ncbi:MAG: hypothetical protein PHF86_01645 [Candidatus Nanoarchaeia archaeon]|nr:hypothetical protein [Candidatus Nanoarchaeia archaeon]
METIEHYKENIGKKVQRYSKTGAIKKFRSGLYYNTIKDVIDHPIIHVPAYIFEEDDNYIECRRCPVVELDKEGNPIAKKKGPANTPRTTGNLLIVHPVNLGNHNNVYFIARDRKRHFKFKICCFNNDCSAYIMEFESNIDKDLLNPQVIYDSINKGIGKWDFQLRTDLSNLFNSSFKNAEDLLNNIELKKEELVKFGVSILSKFYEKE